LLGVVEVLVLLLELLSLELELELELSLEPAEVDGVVGSLLLVSALVDAEPPEVDPPPDLLLEPE